MLTHRYDVFIVVARHIRKYCRAGKGNPIIDRECSQVVNNYSDNFHLL